MWMQRVLEFWLKTNLFTHISHTRVAPGVTWAYNRNLPVILLIGSTQRAFTPLLYSHLPLSPGQKHFCCC